MNTHGNYWGGSPNSLETDDGELARLKTENTRLKRTVTELGKDNASLKKSVNTITAKGELARVKQESWINAYTELLDKFGKLNKAHDQLNVDFKKMVDHAINQTKEIEGLKSSIQILEDVIGELNKQRKEIFTEGCNG